MNDEISKLLQENIDSLLYTTNYAHFDNFSEMEKYLEMAQAQLTHKIQYFDEKIQIVHDQFIRASSVFELNNKKRQKQQQLLKMERDRTKSELEIHKERLNIQIHPMTMVLKQKKIQLQKLEQTKEIIQDFNKLVKGNEQQIKNLMPLDEKNFKNSALRIYVFQALLQNVTSSEYECAKIEIDRKYKELKNKILHNFKEGYWKKDSKQMRNVLPYCQQYELIDEISDFYNEQAFNEVLKVTKLNEEQEGEKQIKNMFFLIERGFNYAFSRKDTNLNEINPYQISLVMGQFSQTISRKLITYVFQKIIRQSIESVLRSFSSPTLYLKYLQIFYNESKELLKNTESIISDDRVAHLMSTYFQSIFDSYLDSYLSKQLNGLAQVYQDCSSQMMEQIMEASQSITKRQNQISSRKNTFKKIMDFNLDSNKKKTIMNGEQVRAKVQSLTKIFMNPSLQLIFASTKQSLLRNSKIAKINQTDKNRNQILQIFISSLQEIIQNLIHLIGQIVPPFDERAPPLDQQFFSIIPNINLLLQRVELIYEEYKKQAKYSFSEGIKLQQKKETFFINCSKSLNKVVSEALASILTVQNTILKSQPNQYYLIANKPAPSHQLCTKVISVLQKYVRAINRIGLQLYRNNILKSLGMQFCTLLTDYYAQIPYTEEGLSRIFMDIAKFKPLIGMFCCDDVDHRFKVLRTLIDIYVIKNDEKAIMSYVTTEKQGNLMNEKDELIQKFITNKLVQQKQK